MTVRRSGKTPAFVPQKDMEISWDSFNGGLNTYSKPTELKPNELAQADNLMLTGVGTPTSRWGVDFYKGTTIFTQVAADGIPTSVTYLDSYYNANTSTNLLLANFGNGYIYKIVDDIATKISGATFPVAGITQLYQGTQLGANTYIACGTYPYIRFNGTNLIPYVGVGNPTNASVAQLSSASGFNTYSWIITATSLSGENTGSVAKTLASLPLDLKQTSIKVSWNTVSAAASVLTGYNVYRGFPGRETLLATVDSATTQYIDTGLPASNTIFPPTSDTTSGPRAKYILKVDDRIILAGIANDPSKVLISARYPYQDRFTALDGGGYCYVSPDDGDEITGLGIQHIQTTNKLITVYKKNSTHVISLDTVQLGNYVVLDPTVTTLSTSNGSSPGTIVAVEQDTYSFGRKGLYSTGQEPQYLNQIRTNEISARIRPYVQSLTQEDFQYATAVYIDYKYLLSIPTRQEVIVYDRQRAAFMGPWKVPLPIITWLKYFDLEGKERWLAGTLFFILEFSSAYLNDLAASGTAQAIVKILRTRKEDFKQWHTMKMMKYFYFLIRNARGAFQINLRLEGRAGTTNTEKSTTITSELGDGGWGSDLWGDQLWGQTEASITLTGDEIARYSIIYKQFRVMQVEVIADQFNSNFEFLGIKSTAVSLGPSSLPSTLKV